MHKFLYISFRSEFYWVKMGTIYLTIFIYLFNYIYYLFNYIYYLITLPKFLHNLQIAANENLFNKRYDAAF